jgi:hypothetical protein
MFAFQLLASLVLLPELRAGVVDVSDLENAFRDSSSTAYTDHLQNSVHSEVTDPTSRYLDVLACAPYNEVDELRRHVQDFPNHPVYSSWRDQRVCYTFQTKNSPPVLLKSLSHANIDLTIIPPMLKFDDSIESLLDPRLQYPDGMMRDEDLVLEVALGLGVQGKGIEEAHSVIGEELLTRADILLGDASALAAHWQSFYWTSPAALTAHITPDATPSTSTTTSTANLLLNELHTRRDRFFTSGGAAKNRPCDYSIEVGSRSHLHITAPASIATLTDHSAACLVFLASVAVMTPGVSHVSAFRGYATMEDPSEDTETVQKNSTDQNAWLQSGNHDDTPYSDIGIDGEGYVLGIVDTGSL